MTQQQVNEDGYTPEELVKIIPNDLSVDGISFASIISDFKDQYNLTLEELIHYVRLSIYELYDRDAGPVKMATKQETDRYWIYQLQYGRTKEEIADNVIKEWKEDDYKDPDYMKLWFALLDEDCYVPEETAS